jgi:transposase-like protein
LILDGTVVRVSLDRKATSIVLLVVLGICEDGQKVLLAVRNMGGETSEAWRSVLDDLVKRGLRKPEFLIVDGGTGLEQALAVRAAQFVLARPQRYVAGSAMRLARLHANSFRSSAEWADCNEF